MSERADAAERAAVAYRALADLAETVEDEWQYVTDLTDAYLPSIRALGGGTAPLPVGAAAAVDEAIAEIGLISDPHRAIDWLSTFPHVVAIALGGDVEGPESASAEGTEAAGPEPPGPDDDSPFGVLLRFHRSRFQDAARDARTVVYAGIQADPLVARVAVLLAAATPAERWMARAVMNGERTDPEIWRWMFPALFGEGPAGAGPAAELRAHAESLLAASLEVANRGEQARSSYRGAVVEELTAQLLARRDGPVRRERRVLFDGVPAEIHPYDVTVELPERPAVYDCKWGARGINADVLNQLDDARSHAADEEVDLTVALVVFDARRSAAIRLARSTARREGTRLVALETIDELGGLARE